MPSKTFQQAVFRSRVEALIERGLAQTPYAAAYRVRCQAAITGMLEQLPPDGPGLSEEEISYLCREQA